MYNLILDSDALIKLTYSKAIFMVCKTFNCLITNEIKEETAEDGKKRFYPDALVIEKLIKDNLVKIRDPKRKPSIKEDAQTEFGTKFIGFGKGEKSVLGLYHSTRNSIIVSDDSAFIKHLEDKNIQFFVPADLIILLKKLNKISLKEATHFLDGIKVFIKEEVYNETKKELKEV